MGKKKQKKSFVFVLNHIDIKGKLPVEVAPGHFFEKANAEQIRGIKEKLDLLRPFGPHRIINLPFPYEVNIIRVYSGKHGSFSTKYEPLPEDKWRYYIISFKGSNVELERIGWAASLLKHDLELGFSILKNLPTGAEAFGWHKASLFSFFESPKSDEPAVTVDSREIKEIKENYILIKQINPEHEHLKRGLRKLHDLKSLPRNSELVVIALFAIIESLITHDPKLPDLGDSLSHQIRTKMLLLDKRFQRKLDHEQYFKNLPKKNLWSELYNYRSSIVHGNNYKIPKKLKDQETITGFLKEAVKLLLLISLKEPDLLTDLKSC